MEWSHSLEVTLEPDRIERNNNSSIIILSNRECDDKAFGVAVFNCLKLEPVGFRVPKATRGCRLSSTELEPVAVVTETIVKIRAFAIGLGIRLLASRRPWLLTAIRERNFADVNHSWVYRNKVSNNLVAAPGTLISVRSNGVRR